MYCSSESKRFLIIPNGTHELRNSHERKTAGRGGKLQEEVRAAADVLTTGMLSGIAGMRIKALN